MSEICLPYKEAKKEHITQGFHSNHLAIDIAFAYGTFLVAPEDCVVEKIIEPITIQIYLDDLKRGYGIRLKSLTEPATYYSFWHCLPFFPVSVGDKVRQGQPVAMMGNSGDVKSGGVLVPLEERTKPPYRGTHLHYSINRNGIEIDPMTLIDWDIPIKFDLLTAIQMTLFRLSNFLKGRVA